MLPDLAQGDCSTISSDSIVQCFFQRNVVENGLFRLSRSGFVFGDTGVQTENKQWSE